MAERFELVEKALLKMLEEKKYSTLRDILVTMNPSDVAGLFVDLHLKINEQFYIFVSLFGVLVHDLGERFALDVLGNDSPLTVNHRDLKHLRDIEPRFLNSRLIQGLV